MESYEAKLLMKQGFFVLKDVKKNTSKKAVSLVLTAYFW